MFQEMNFSHVILDSFNIWKLSKAQDAISHQALVWNNDWWSTIFESFNAHTKQIFFTNRSELNHFSIITQLENCRLLDFPPVFQIAASSNSNNKSTRQINQRTKNAAWKWDTAGWSQMFSDWITSPWTKFHFQTRLVQLHLNSKASSLKSLVQFRSPRQEFEPLQMAY